MVKTPEMAVNALVVGQSVSSSHPQQFEWSHKASSEKSRQGQ